jgi:DNA-binding NarL/FixJ family response regulator
MNGAITTALLHADQAYSQLLRIVLESDPVQRVSVFLEVRSALEQLPGLGPDVLLADLSLGGSAPAEFVKALGNSSPRMAIVILGQSQDERSIISVLQAGASGYLLKNTPLAAISDAVHQAKAGLCPISPSVARTVAEWFHSRRTDRPARQLSSRERQVLSQAAQGVRVREIAQDLKLSQATVRAHLQNAYKKLNVHSLGEATAHLSREVSAETAAQTGNNGAQSL